MSRANANNKNNPANRGIGGHIKEGLKNVPKMYNALYNAPAVPGNKNSPKIGVKSTVASNVRTVATGKSAPGLPSKAPAGQRVKIAAVGAASITPLGPLAAVGLGIKNSVKAKADAKAAIKAAAPKVAAKPLTPVQQAQAKKAKDLKKTLNEAMPGLNMK